MAGSKASISSVTPSKTMEMSLSGDERSEGRVGIWKRSTSEVSRIDRRIVEFFF